MQMTTIRLLNTLAIAIVRRPWHIDALSAGWATWKGLDISVLPSLIGPPPRARPIDSWEARSVIMRDGAFATGPIGDPPAAWTDGDRLSLDVRISAEARIKGGHLFINGDLPETVVQALPGLPLSAAVDLPFPIEARIVRTAREGGHLRIDLLQEWVPLRKALTTKHGPERLPASRTTAMPRHDPIDAGTAPDLDITIDHATAQMARLKAAIDLLRVKRTRAMRVFGLCEAIGCAVAIGGLIAHLHGTKDATRSIGTSLMICGAMLAVWILFQAVTTLIGVNGVLRKCEEQAVRFREAIDDAETFADTRQAV